MPEVFISFSLTKAAGNEEEEKGEEMLVVSKTN